MASAAYSGDGRIAAALAQIAKRLVGRTADPDQLVAEIERFQAGLDAELNFAALAIWGGARLVQPVDDSKWGTDGHHDYKVPDLFMVVRGPSGVDHPCWVEVKSSSISDRLRISRRTYDRMIAFERLTGLPYLVAFRNMYGLWVLREVSTLAPVDSAFQLNLDAFKESLLGLLLNDALIVVAAGAGLTIELARLGQRDDRGETVRIEDVYPHGGDGVRIDEPPRGWHYVLSAVDAEDESIITEDRITQRFSAPQEGNSAWLHQVFSHLAISEASRGEDEVNWQRLLQRVRQLPSAHVLASELLDAGFVTHVFQLMPHSAPVGFADFAAGLPKRPA
jgi:hypothetical protein